MKKSEDLILDLIDLIIKNKNLKPIECDFNDVIGIASMIFCNNLDFNLNNMSVLLHGFRNIICDLLDDPQLNENDKNMLLILHAHSSMAYIHLPSIRHVYHKLEYAVGIVIGTKYTEEEMYRTHELTGIHRNNLLFESLTGNINRIQTFIIKTYKLLPDNYQQIYKKLKI